MPSSTPQRNIRLKEELYEKVLAISQREERSFSSQVGYVLKLYVEQYEKDNGPIDTTTINQEP